MPAEGNYVGGCVTLVFTCILCSAAGVGGGGINVPVLLLIFGYGFDTAVVLSLFIVLGNALAQSYLNMGKTHPTFTNLPLIYWELIIILLPAQLGGSNIGSILSKILPKSVLYVLAFCVLSFASVMSYFKAIHRYHDEKIADKEKAENKPEEDSGFRKSLASDDIHEGRTSIVDEMKDSTHALESILKSFLKTTASDPDAPKVIYPVKVIAVIIIVWIIYTLLIITIAIKGKCNNAYTAIIICLYIPLTAGVAFGVYNSRTLGDIFQDKTIEKKENSVEFSSIDHETGKKKPSDNDNDNNNDGDDSMNKRLLTPSYNQGTIVRENSIVMALSTVCIGIICSLLGIGGGELLSPLLLSFHILPQVTSATSATLSFSNTLSLVIRAFVEGTVDIGSAIILFVIGFCGGFIGRKLGLIISFEYNRASFIIFALVGVLIVSAIYYIYELATEPFENSLSALC